MSRAPAFLVPVLIASFFGAGGETDAYFIAYGAVLFVGGTLAQGIEQAIVPFAAREIGRERSAARIYLDRSARRASTLGAALWVAGTVLVSVLSPSGIPGDTVKFCVFFAPLPIFWSGAAVYSGALVSQSAIGSASASLLWRGAGALLGFAVVPFGGGLWTVALGLGTGEGIRVWWLRRLLWKQVALRPGGEVSSARPLARAAGAQVVASSAIGVAPLIERLMALRVGIGAASHLEYAVRLLGIPGVVFDGALAPLLLAKWSQELALGRAPTRKTVRAAVSKGLALALLIGVSLAILAPSLVELLFGRGRFTTDDIRAVSVLLRVLAAGFVATMGALLLERVYIASSRNRILAWLSIGRALLRVGVAYVLLRRLELMAFAVGYLVADWAYLAALTLLFPFAFPAMRANVDRVHG